MKEDKYRQAMNEIRHREAGEIGNLLVDLFRSKEIKPGMACVAMAHVICQIIANGKESQRVYDEFKIALDSAFKNYLEIIKTTEGKT